METATLIIPALQNQAVAIAVAQALEAVSGVASVSITLAHTRARVGFNDVMTTPAALRAAVQTAGFVVDEAPARQGCCGGCGG